MTPRDRRALLLGAVAVASAVLVLRVLPAAVRAMHAQRTALAAKRALLARVLWDLHDARALTDSAPAVERRLLALAPKLVTGRQEADAVAELLGRVAAVAGEEKVKVVGTVPIPDSTRVGRLRRITVRASLEGDTRGTLRAVGRLERGPALLVVRELRIVATDPDAPRDRPEVLQSEVVVQGWYLEPRGGRAGGRP